MITISSDTRAKISQIKITRSQFQNNQKEVVHHIAGNETEGFLAAGCCKLVQVQGEPGYLHGREIL